MCACLTVSVKGRSPFLQHLLVEYVTPNTTNCRPSRDGEPCIISHLALGVTLKLKSKRVKNALNFNLTRTVHIIDVPAGKIR